MPLRPWAVAERVTRNLPERGYDDPTAHCFPAGVPRSMYVPTSYQFIQTPDYFVILHERTSWRIIDMKRTQHLPDKTRLWQGDSLGHWEGDTLVVDTIGLNDKSVLTNGVPHTEQLHVVERFKLIENGTKLEVGFTVDEPLWLGNHD